jgi:hypothetical protein
VFKREAYADVPHFIGKHTVERVNEQSALPATVLRPSYFIQNDIQQKELLLNHGVYGIPTGSKGISMVDIRDIGEATARQLLRRESASRPLPFELYELVGPDALNATSMAAIWVNVLHHPIRYVGDDLDAFETRLKAFAPQWYAYDMRLMMRRYQQGGAVASSPQLERFTSLLGRMPRRRGRTDDKRFDQVDCIAARPFACQGERPHILRRCCKRNIPLLSTGGGTLGYSAFAQSGEVTEWGSCSLRRMSPVLAGFCPSQAQFTAHS